MSPLRDSTYFSMKQARKFSGLFVMGEDEDVLVRLRSIDGWSLLSSTPRAKSLVYSFNNLEMIFLRVLVLIGFM